jgi:ferredoxin
MPFLFNLAKTNSLMESSTFQIHQDVCVGCGACVGIAPDHIMINDNGVACFIKTGTDTANFGTEDVSQIFEAAESCPDECIEEIG